MKKNWSNPEIKTLGLESTEASHIIIKRMNSLGEFETFGFKYAWFCDCCGANSLPTVYQTEQEAKEAAIREHGDPCPNMEFGCSA